MITITDRYEQVQFNDIIGNNKYVGTCNIQNNELTNIEVTIYTLENYLVGNMSTRDGIGISVSLNDMGNLELLKDCSEVLKNFKIELETMLLNK